MNFWKYPCISPESKTWRWKCHQNTSGERIQNNHHGQRIPNIYRFSLAKASSSLLVFFPLMLYPECSYANTRLRQGKVELAQYRRKVSSDPFSESPTVTGSSERRGFSLSEAQSFQYLLWTGSLFIPEYKLSSWVRGLTPWVSLDHPLGQP